MSTPYLGEIRAVSFNFAPKGWAQCNGQLLPINQYSALFALLGTQFGGDGIQTFALPDLRGRVAIHQGQGNGAAYTMGEALGLDSVTLTTDELPAHRHYLRAVITPSNRTDPAQGIYAVPTSSIYGSNPNVQLASDAMTSVGDGAAHENRQPFTCLLYIIALQGIFPSQT